MKKHLYHLLVFSLLGIFAASCSDDDDAPNIQSEIVGEWRLGQRMLPKDLRYT